MKTENLSLDAATVIAMTERGTEPTNPDTNPTLDESWQADFALMVARSGAEIEGWANAQNSSAITFVPGDNDILVSQRADGMLVITSSLNGVAQGDPQIVDPSLSDRIVINAGSGDDEIRIDPSVTSNLLLAGGSGKDFIYGGAGNDIIIGGDGDDLIRAGAGSDIVLGSAGNDNLEGGDNGDILMGGLGDDYASGGSGNDLVMGGDGEDSLYGGANEDILLGERGDDYIDGGIDNDLAIGGVGDDIVSGGKGNDTVAGNAGADQLIGASGADTFTNVDTDDTVIVDTLAAANSERLVATGANIKLIEIDHDAGMQSLSFASGQRDEFVSRTQDDLETLRSLEAGQAMLNALDQAKRDSYEPRKYFLGIPYTSGYEGHRIVLEELDSENQIDKVRNPFDTTIPTMENGRAIPADGNRWTSLDPVNAPNSGTSATVKYNPTVDLQLNTGKATPPIVILFHEFAHAYNMVTGTGLEGVHSGPVNNGVSKFERQATGLAVDHDNDASTPDQLVPGHAFELTENGLRSELGLTQRPRY